MMTLEPNAMENDVKFQVTILDTEESYQCDEVESLLHAMVRLGRKGIPSGCHGGGCGVCKVHVTAGTCRKLAMSRAHVSEQEEQDGIALACRVYPTSDVDLKVLGKMRAKVCGTRKYGLV